MLSKTCLIICNATSNRHYTVREYSSWAISVKFSSFFWYPRFFETTVLCSEKQQNWPIQSWFFRPLPKGIAYFHICHPLTHHLSTIRAGWLFPPFRFPALFIHALHVPILDSDTGSPDAGFSYGKKVSALPVNDYHCAFHKVLHWIQIWILGRAVFTSRADPSKYCWSSNLASL